MKQIVAGILLLTCAVLAVYVFQWTGRSRRAGKDVTIAYTFTLRNTGHTPIKTPSAAILVPLARAAYQERTQIRCNYPFSLRDDALGNQSLALTWDLLPPYSEKIVTVKTSIRLRPDPRKETPEDPNAYLASEPFIESDHPMIRQMADSLKTRNRLETVKNIYTWVGENVSYIGYVKLHRGALYALNHKQGDCTEYAALFTALCRAAGVPARMVGGFVCPRDMVVDLGDYHDWAEFYLDGRWHLADPQAKQFMRNLKGYVAFNIVHALQAENAFCLIRSPHHGIGIKLNS